MNSQSQNQADPSVQAQSEVSTDSSRYTAPSVIEADRLNAITGTAKVTG